MWQNQGEKQFLWLSFLRPTCSLEQARLHPHLSLWPSLNGLKVLYLNHSGSVYKGTWWAKIPPDHPPSYASWSMTVCTWKMGLGGAASQFAQKFPLGQWWLSLYSPDPPLNWKFLESRSCLIVLCTLTVDCHSGSSPGPGPLLSGLSLIPRLLSVLVLVCAWPAFTQNDYPSASSNQAILIIHWLFLSFGLLPSSLSPSLPPWVGRWGRMGVHLVWWPPILNGNHHPTRCGFSYPWLYLNK